MVVMKLDFESFDVLKDTCALGGLNIGDFI